MGESRTECMPWLDEEGGGTGGGVRVATATVMEGAEVVRTAAVSYATPILHQVFIQSSPGGGNAIRHGNRSTAPPEIGVVALSSQDNGRASPGPFRVAVTPATAPSLVRSYHHQHNGVATKGPGNGEGTVASTPLSNCGLSTVISASGASPSSLPLWVFSSSLISSSSVVLRPITHLSTSSTSLISSSSPMSPLSTPSPPILSLPLCSVGAGKSDDELTSLSWLQDSNLLMGTALSPIKPQPQSNSESTSSTGSSSHSSLGPAMPPSGERKKGSRRSSNSGSRKEGAAAGSFVGFRNEDGCGKEGQLKRVPVVESPRAESDDLLKAESPTSDYGEESCDAAGDGNEEAKHNSRLSQATPTQPIPYNPKIHVKAKPPFSFSCLIFMAIEESPTKALPVKDIYSWILDHYPYYRNAPTGWKNSVRHNLSLNKCFSKVEKAPNLGKGSLWMVDPTFRPNLLQAMSKTPLSPQGGSSFDTKNCIVSNKAIINTKYLYGLTSRPPDKIISLGDFVVQNEVEVRPSSTATATVPCQQVHHHAEAMDVSSKSSSDLRQTKNTPSFNNLSPELTSCVSAVNPVFSDSSSSLESDGAKKNGSSELRKKSKNKNCPHSTSTPSSYSSPTTSTTLLNTPNPELFPRLAKRLLLESSKEESETLRHRHFEPSPIGVQSEDVDAAAAMLVLKHGPRVLSPYHENFPNLQTNSNLGGRRAVNGPNTRDYRSSESSSDSGLMVISSSPSLDHAYVSQTARKSGPCTQQCSSELTSNKATPVSWSQATRRAKDVTSNTSPASSVDEAFFDDSFENEVTDTTVTSLEPPPFEEADALLNLASVATSLASGQRLVTEDELGDTTCCSESQSYLVETQSKIHSRMKSNFTKLMPSRRHYRNGSINGSRKVDIGINPSQQMEESSRSDAHKKSLKRKANYPAKKIPPSKKPADFPSAFPPKSGLIRTSHNNNSNTVLNRNKLLKIKKVLRSNKAKC